MLNFPDKHRETRVKLQMFIALYPTIKSVPSEDFSPHKSKDLHSERSNLRMIFYNKMGS